MMENIFSASAPPVEAFPQAVKASQTGRYVLLMQEWKFLLPLSVLAELILEPEIYTLPYSSQYFKGLCNIRGNIVPVYTPFSQHNTQILYFPQQDGFSIIIDGLKLEYFNKEAELADIPSFIPDRVKPFILQTLQKENEVYLECDWAQWIQSQL